MALSNEQQAGLEVMVSQEKIRVDSQLSIESVKNKMEAVRIAKEVLFENSRSKPVDSRDISAEDITAFAETLTAYINGQDQT